jgi:DNA-binding NarL/FixJ family response regulator
MAKRRRRPWTGDADPTVRPDVSLSERERQIVRLLLDGLTNKEIGNRLGVSDQTVKNQLTTLYRKVGVANRLQLLVRALQENLLADS